ncbi:MAG: hypothetical protein KDK28_14835, partial [Maritimibacter sp.]|nr:hypothetical protein [Maritimibacter sp.]
REILGVSDLRQFTANTKHTVNDICAEVQKVHEQGYCLIDRELEQSLVAISVPLINYHGETLAAVNVCGHPGNLSTEDLETRCLPALQAATRRIAQMLV